jgi:hypothetical protein
MLLPSDSHVDKQTVNINQWSPAFNLRRLRGALPRAGPKNREYSAAESSQPPQNPSPATSSDRPTRLIIEHLEEDYTSVELREQLSALLLLTYPTGTPVKAVVQNLEKTMTQVDQVMLPSSSPLTPLTLRPQPEAVRTLFQFCARIADAVQTEWPRTTVSMKRKATGTASDGTTKRRKTENQAIKLAPTALKRPMLSDVD